MKKSSVKWLSSAVGFQKIYIIILLVIQILNGLTGVLYALLLRSIIDCAVSRDKQGFFLNVGLIIGLVLMQILFRSLSRYFEEKAKAVFENLLKEKLFSCLLKKQYSQVTAVHSGEWINRLTNDTVVCANGLVEILPGISGTFVRMAGAMIMILALEPKFAFILIPGGCGMLVFTYLFRKVLKRLHKTIQEKDGKLRIFLQENLSSLVMIRSFAAESQAEKEALEKMQDHKASRIRRSLFSIFSNAAFMGVMNGMYLIGLVYGGYGIINGTVSYGTMTALLQLISQVQFPLANITGYMPKFYAMTASAERLMEAEDFEDDCSQPVKSAQEIKNFYSDEFKKIGFRNAAFTYISPSENENSPDKNPLVLNNISLEIHKGEYIAFTGHSGCGKSTLLKLLMCLYKLDSGERYITGNAEEPLTSQWHRLFAYVPQGNQLMSGTVREIVAFSDKEQKNCDERIFRALDISCASEFIGELSGGIDTMLGERGAGLSEGQMQRIAVARAVFSDAPILLLDESTSALDEITEKKLLENLKNMTDKTVLIVTHRPAAIEICDRILNFTENGIEWLNE